VGPGSRLSLHDSVRHHITKFSVEEIASEGNAAEIVIQGEEIEFIDYDELVTNVNTVMLTMADFV
jgi:hypothetical protein